MKKLIKFNAYLTSLLDEAMRADMDYKIKQAWFRYEMNQGIIPETRDFVVAIGNTEKYLNYNDIAPDQLSIEELKFDFHLQQYVPCFFMRIYFWFRKIEISQVYQMAPSTPAGIVVSVTLKRTDAFSPLTADYSTQETEEKFLVV